MQTKKSYAATMFASLVLFVVTHLLHNIIITTSFPNLVASSNNSLSVFLILNTTSTTTTTELDDLPSTTSFTPSVTFSNETSSVLLTSNMTTTVTTAFNTHWHNVRYVSGLLTLRNPPDGHGEDLIRKQCNRQYGRISDVRQTLKDKYCSGPIVSNYSCCYCYYEYPNFMAVDDAGRKWLQHKIHIEQELQQLRQQRVTSTKNSSTSMGMIDYWFCMEQRENELSKVPLNVPDNIQLAVITGKFGHNDRFQEEVNTFCEVLKGLEIFQSRNKYRTDFHCLHSDPDYVLNDHRFQRHMRYKNESTDISRKGGGYWFHKAVIVRHLMGQYKENDYMIYCDIDRLEFFRSGTFHALIDAMTARNAELLIETTPNLEHWYNKEDVLVAFNATNEMRSSKQVTASAFIVRNTIRMRHFYDQLITCQSDWHMISDEKSFLPARTNAFREHRHDQAILSMFIKAFLRNSNKVVVGPLAQGYSSYSAFHTYQFNDSVNVNQNTLFVKGEEPYCPFEQFYAKLPEMKNSFVK